MGLNPTVVNAEGFGGSSSSVSIISTTVEHKEEREMIFQFYTYMNIYLTNTSQLPLALF